jgi:hypothetical protein
MGARLIRTTIGDVADQKAWSKERGANQVITSRCMFNVAVYGGRSSQCCGPKQAGARRRPRSPRFPIHKARYEQREPAL